MSLDWKQETAKKARTTNYAVIFILVVAFEVQTGHGSSLACSFRAATQQQVHTVMQSTEPKVCGVTWHPDDGT